jgi:hypothetical protein
MHAALTAVHDYFHESRAQLFVRLMRPSFGSTLLDLGGSQGTLAARICRHVPLRVTVADVDPSQRSAVERRGFRHVTLDDSRPLPFERGEFDFVLSNSVIEHVTLPKARCRIDSKVPAREWRLEARRAQQRFAGEIRVVGRSYFVQTPHKHFPVDPHLYLPFVQYFTRDIACRIAALTDRWWLNDCGGMVDWCLLTPRDMRVLFPDAEISVERFAGLPKSIVAYRRALGGELRATDQGSHSEVIPLGVTSTESRR